MKKKYTFIPYVTSHLQPKKYGKNKTQSSRFSDVVVLPRPTGPEFDTKVTSVLTKKDTDLSPEHILFDTFGRTYMPLYGQYREAGILFARGQFSFVIDDVYLVRLRKDRLQLAKEVNNSDTFTLKNLLEFPREGKDILTLHNNAAGEIGASLGDWKVIKSLNYSSRASVSTVVGIVILKYIA